MIPILEWMPRGAARCLGAAAAVAMITCALPAGAAEEAGAPERPDGFRYRGTAVYLGGGAGAIADEHVATANARLLGVLALSRWAMLEGMIMGYRYAADDHHGNNHAATGLGIGVGFRAAPPPTWLVRPYAAVRAAHVHLTPDHWGEHETLGTTDIDDHHSVHRFGAAIAGGFDAPLGGRDSRWRLGVETEALALGGPGANVFLQAVATVGFAL
jgi:hypothetical protein